MAKSIIISPTLSKLLDSPAEIPTPTYRTPSCYRPEEQNMLSIISNYLFIGFNVNIDHILPHSM